MNGDVKERSLDFGDFMEVILQMRGTNVATVKDIMDLRKFVSVTTKRLDEKLVCLNYLNALMKQHLGNGQQMKNAIIAETDKVMNSHMDKMMAMMEAVVKGQPATGKAPVLQEAAGVVPPAGADAASALAIVPAKQLAVTNNVHPPPVIVPAKDVW